MRYILILFFLLGNKFSFSQESDWWQLANRPDEEGIQWLKGHLKERLAENHLLKDPLDSASLSPSKHCQGCGSNSSLSDKPASLFVFMSFSLKDSLWIEYSKELEPIGGVFVLRGLPQNSFKELANRIFELKQKGVSVPIQIHPQLFTEYDIHLVPAIVVADNKSYDKISGNLTLKFALEKMALLGETQQAKTLYQQVGKK